MYYRHFNHWDTLYRHPPITKIHYIETLQSQRYMLQRPSNHWDTLYRDPPITICCRDPPITEIYFIETVQSLIYVIETLKSLGYTLQIHSNHTDTHGIEAIHSLEFTKCYAHSNQWHIFYRDPCYKRFLNKNYTCVVGIPPSQGYIYFKHPKFNWIQLL